MKIIHTPRLEQGDLLFVTARGCIHPNINPRLANPQNGSGWLLVTELSVNNEIIHANFCPHGGKGYGDVLWPAFDTHVLIRGSHGDTAPYAAFVEIFGKTSAVAITT